MRVAAGAWVLFALMSISTGCADITAPDLEQARSEILQLEAEQRTFHFSKNAKGLTDLFSDNFISINRGVVSRPLRDSSRVQFQAYFDRVDFIQWDDITEPEIRFSQDGNVAYVVIDKQVVVRPVGVPDTVIPDTSHFAWLSVYRRSDDGWKLDVIASTNE